MMTDAAQDDMAAVYDYIASSRSFGEAEELEARMLARMATLTSFPLPGPMPKELRSLGVQDVRQQVLGVYRIFYRVIGEIVLVSSIADGRRDLTPLLQRRLLNR